MASHTYRITITMYEAFHLAFVESLELVGNIIFFNDLFVYSLITMQNFYVDVQVFIFVLRSVQPYDWFNCQW